MKNDIKFLPVENVHIAVVKEQDPVESSWAVYLINRNDFPLENIFVRSKGYGNYQDEKQETSVLRHHFPLVHPKDNVMVEPIDPSVFHLNNEYWVSYYVENQVYDKKFIFLPDTIINENLIHIPELDLPGILHS